MKVGKKNYSKRIVIPVAVILGGLFLATFAFFSWLIGEDTLTATSDAQFCVTCHSMEPFEQAHEADVHGGNNAHGVRATCVDCHLPHDNSLHYIQVKTETGLHDLWVENFGDPDNVDWEAGREHREDYTYDSGCLSCHSSLEAATMATNKALIAHKPYFAGEIDDQCVTCHPHVGHANLSDYISQN